jgi:hypothetical protein
MDAGHPDIAAWADAAVTLLQSPQKIAPLDLSWDNLATQHCQLYAKILNS